MLYRICGKIQIHPRTNKIKHKDWDNHRTVNKTVDINE